MALDHEQDDDLSVLSDDSLGPSENGSKKGAFRGLGRTFQRLATGIGRVAASAQEMLKDEELRK